MTLRELLGDEEAEAIRLRFRTAALRADAAHRRRILENMRPLRTAAIRDLERQPDGSYAKEPEEGIYPL
ncbi:MAG: hypothetical protein V3W32_06830 [Gemmatimonadota bacterium]